jgi:hypothetical protein
MIRSKPAAGPAITLLKLNAQQIVDLVELTVFYASLTMIALKLQGNNSIRRDRGVDFKACARRGNVFENSPFTANGTGFRFPLDFDQIGAKLSIFQPFVFHI